MISMTTRSCTPSVADQFPHADGSSVGSIEEVGEDVLVLIPYGQGEGATVLTAPPTDGAYTNDIVDAAQRLAQK